MVVDLDVHLNSEESLAEQIAILKQALCPMCSCSEKRMNEECEMYLNMWYPRMAGCMYNHFLKEQDICSQFWPDCTLRTRALSQDWTCEECTRVLAAIADYMAMEDTIAEGVNYLKGSCFCG